MDWNGNLLLTTTRINGKSSTQWPKFGIHLYRVTLNKGSPGGYTYSFCNSISAPTYFPPRLKSHETADWVAAYRTGKMIIVAYFQLLDARPCPSYCTLYIVLTGWPLLYVASHRIVSPFVTLYGEEPNHSINDWFVDHFEVQFATVLF